MAELNKIRFLLFLSMMIFSAQALDVIISGAHQNFKQRSEIKAKIIDEEKKYSGTLSPLTYEAGVNISKVIVYIIDRSRYVEIIRNSVRQTRLQIAEELKQCKCELVFLGIENFDDNDYDLIGEFILEKIQPNPNQTKQGLTIEVIGENHFDRSYQCHWTVFERYQENTEICGGALIARLRDIQHGALKPVESANKKLIKLLAYLPPEYSVEQETMWSVRVEDYKYVPAVDVKASKYNFRINHPNKKICVLVLDRKEYLAVTSLGSNSPKRKEIRKILKKMTKHNEVFYIMGAFYFDWTEVYLVAQIILQHTQGLQGSRYNVSACGFGMFDTFYLNEDKDDGRFIQEPQDHVLKIRKALFGEVKKRAIKLFYYTGDRCQHLQMPTNLGNGRYVPESKCCNYTLPWLNRRIAFFVYDTTEVNHPIDCRTVNYIVEELRQSFIFLVVMEAINFKSYDKHIIAEWIDMHRGEIYPEQIAVFGVGSFDTIFQSERTTYGTCFDTGRIELKTIRDTFLNSGNKKKVLAAKIDDENFEVWSYPMNTVINGVYETDLIPDKNMFSTIDRKKIFFIITSAYNFRQISAIQNLTEVSAAFRKSIRKQYPKSGWNVFLVGLDNFNERDSHFFAELVQMQTHDERALEEFVCVFNYGIAYAVYQYKDTAPFIIDFEGKIESRISVIFGKECSLLDDTSSD